MVMVEVRAKDKVMVMVKVGVRDKVYHRTPHRMHHNSN
jgi:hypothetical protein